MDTSFGCFASLDSPVEWRSFGREAFDEAQTADKRLIIVLGVSWCPYSQRLLHQLSGRPEDVARLNRDYVPVLVDTDNRPDLHSRYAAGGWPSIIVADHTGQPLWRGTHIPLPRLGALLGAFVARPRTTVPATQVPPSNVAIISSADSTALGMSAVAAGIRSVVDAFDARHHGFGLADHGRGPRFPHLDAIDLLLEPHRGDIPSDHASVARQALRRLMDRGLWDPEQGGLRRYAAGFDWSDTHDEKLLVDNALFLSTLCRAAHHLDDDQLRVDARDALTACRSLFDIDGPAFAASTRPAHPEVPDEWPVDPLDRSVLVDANAAMLSALLAAAQALSDDRPLERARSLAEYLCRTVIDTSSGAAVIAAHRIDAGRVIAGPQVADWYRTGEALLDAQESFGIARYGELAASLFDSLEERSALADRDSDYAPGVPRTPTVAMMQDDAGRARFALRMAEQTGLPRYREAAARALSGYPTRAARGPLAAALIGAASRYTRMAT
jgi:uncharacterized protein YyaL (SSP411 family)